MSNFMNNNQEYLISALNNGIDSSTIRNTLENISEMENPPKQAKKVVETIADMKKVNQNIRDEKYLSKFVRDNSKSIESAINEGISKDEIARTLIEKSNTKSKENNFMFVVKLITRMKKKELSKSNVNNKQFVLKKDK